MNPLLAIFWLVFGSGADSAVSEIRSRYATVQDQLKANACLRWDSEPPVVIACPDGGLVRRTDATDSGKITTEWRLDFDSAMFVLVRETLPEKRVRETRVYRTPKGPHSSNRIGPSSTIQNQPQLPGVDSTQAQELLDEGTRLWRQAQISAMDFPFSAVTVRGMVLVEEKSALQTNATPEVGSREVRWRLEPNELEPWQRQILGKRFCLVGKGVCATAEAFVLYSGRTPHFGEAQSDTPPTEEDLIERHTSAMPPALLLELSQPLDGPVALEDFAPIELSSAIPEAFQKLTDRAIQKETREIDRKYRQYLTDNPQEGGQSGTAATWSSAPGYQEQDRTFSNDKLAIHLFGASSGEDCTSAGFFETLKLGFAIVPTPWESLGEQPGSVPKRKKTKKLEPISIDFPCDPNGASCTLGPAFIPWNRRNVHLHATGWSEHQWIWEMDDTFQWIVHQDFSVPFQDCGC